MNAKIKEMCFAALGAAVLCLLAPFAIPAGVTPITLSLFAVLVISSLLPVRSAFCATLVYVLLGAVGVPVFAGFAGGFHILAGPTGGFIIGYLPISILVSAFGNRGKLKWVVMLLSTILCYIIGSLWLSFTTDVGFIAALWSTCALCAIPDAIKLIAAYFVSGALASRIRIGA